MCKERKMERLEKTWILELVGTALLTAMLGLWGWTANKVVQNGEKIAALDGKIAAVDAKIAAVDAKLDLLISGLDISVAPKDEAAKAEPSAG